MKLSARTRYAARILLDLARFDKGGPVAATLLSQHTGVSVQFIEQILKPLKQAGLTRSTRGASGGHSLATRPDAITLGEVVRLMEGGINLTLCSSEETSTCSSRTHCPTRSAWVKVSRSLEQELDAITMQDLLNDYYTVCTPNREEMFPVCRAEDGNLPRGSRTKLKTVKKTADKAPAGKSAKGEGAKRSPKRRIIAG